MLLFASDCKVVDKVDMSTDMREQSIDVSLSQLKKQFQLMED